MSSSQMSSTSFNRSVEFVDCPSNSNENKNGSFAPLHRTVELENLHAGVNEEKQSTPSKTLSTTTTKKILTKCFTVIGDGTEK